MTSASGLAGPCERPADRYLWSCRTLRTCGGASRVGNFYAYSPWPGCLVPGKGWADTLTCRNCAAR